MRKRTWNKTGGNREQRRTAGGRVPRTASRCVGCLLFMASLSVAAVSGSRVCALRIHDAANRPVALTVEVADTEPLRMKGLMHRRELPRDRGMLFIFDREQKMNFWMKNTLVPLSIAFVGKDGVIKEIYDMKPLDISVTYPSAAPALYALEVNRGWFTSNNISEGCRIDIDGCLGK